MFLDITDTNDLQTRNNDYNFLNRPAIKKYLEKYPTKVMISTWNYLDIDCKSTAEPDEFKILLKHKFLILSLTVMLIVLFVIIDYSW